MMRSLIAMILAACVCLPALADWPQYMGDAERTGVSADKVSPGDAPAWVYDTLSLPSPGFYPNTNFDTLGPQNLRAPSSTFDYAYPVSAADGKLFVASSTQECVFGLDIRTGQLLWSCFVDGAVRFAPLVHDGKVYFGSDDGFVCALE